MIRASEEEESKLKAFVHTLISSLFYFVHIINWVLWVWMSEIRVVIFFYSPILIGFILSSSPMDVGHIDWITLNNGVLSSLSLLAYSCYLFNPYLYLLSLVLEIHCYNKLTLKLVLFSCGFRDGFGKIQSIEIWREE